MMLKQAFRSLIGNPGRSILTGLAVMLGVAFVVGAFVLGDMINKAFDDIFGEAGAGTDAVVLLKETDAGTPSSFGDADKVLADVRAVDGVEAAFGSVQIFPAVVLDKDREPLGQAQGPPRFGFSWVDDSGLNPWKIEEGRAPAAAGEVVLNTKLAETAGFELGDTVEVAPVDAAEKFTLVGLASFGTDLEGATFAFFEAETARKLFNLEGEYNQISVRAQDGVSQEVLTSRIADVLPSELEAVTGLQNTEDQTKAVQSELGIFRNFLLGFAAVALLVASFVIFNTFLIVVAQRSRQLALLRAMGATRWQVRRIVLIEALIVAIVASIVGILVGMGLAAGLVELFKATGNELPTAGVQLLPRTIIVALIVGVLVTLFAALVPAWRASRVSPVEAMRDSQVEETSLSMTSRILAIALPAVGIALLAWGLWGDFGELVARISVMALGALLIFVGAAFLTALLAGPIVKVLGAPVRAVAKVPGRLASENAVRNPGRTAISAAALTIGVALVAFFAIFTSSLSASLDKLIDDQFRADYVAQLVDDEGNNAPFTPILGDRLEAASEIEVVSRWRFADFVFEEDRQALRNAVLAGEGDLDFRDATGVEPALMDAIYNPDIVEGEISALNGEGIFIQSSAAEDLGVGLGDTVEVVFVAEAFRETSSAAVARGVAEAPARPLEVVGIYDDTVWGDYFVSLDTMARDVEPEGDNVVIGRYAEGVDFTVADDKFKEIAKDFPQVVSQNVDELRAEQQSQLNQFLSVVYAMLALAIIIALFGIVITLALAVFERTREIGLLRAIGMGRGQVARMIRWESVLVATLGGIVGIVVGSVLGWIIVSRLSDDIQVLSIPWISLIVFVALSALVGVIASIFPARRAAKMNVLEAVATE